MPNNNNRRNEYVIEDLGFKNVESPMEKFKEQVANEIGLVGYNNMDKRWIPAVQHGYIGGNMTRKMVQFTEQVIASQGPEVLNNVETKAIAPPEVRRMNELASQNFQQFMQGIQSGAYYGGLPDSQQQHLQ